MQWKIWVPVLLALAVFAGVVIADTATTTMTWVVPSAKAHTITYGAACSTSNFYFVESDAWDGNAVIDGNAVLIRPNSSSSGGVTTRCQGDKLAPIRINNTGNVTEDINADMNAALTGTDFNSLVLKVWMGTGVGCGAGEADANGYGGWEANCSATGPVTETTCYAFNAAHAVTSILLIDNLPSGDTNQICFSGDFNGVRGGVASGSFQRIFTTRTN
ncbi:MAG: hypothetical protein V1847_03115 [Candidatus Diapherotrites archaeon]